MESKFKHLYLTFLLLSCSSYAAMTDHFVTTWKTDNPGATNNTSIMITAHDNSLYDVDWDNDGIFDELGIVGGVSHDFGSPGIKTIRMTGDFKVPIFSNNDDREKIISIDQWGTYPWESMRLAFSGASNLINNAIDTPNLSICTDLSGMFSDASSIGSASEQGNWNWDTSTILDMSSMFSRASIFNQDIKSWDTGNVENMTMMFYKAKLFNQNIGSWDTGNVENMPMMFYKAKSFNQDLSGWLVNNVRSFKGMFQFSRLAIDNYDALLLGWSTQNLIQDRIFDAGNSIYCSQSAKNAHDILTSTFGWTIYDEGQCKPELTIISRDRIFIDENQLAVDKILVTDPDFDTVSFSITGGADQQFFNIDANSGVLSLNSSLDYEAPLDLDSDNHYLVGITVTDNGTPQESISKTFTIIIKNTYENLANDDYVTTWRTNNQGISNNSSVAIQTNPNLNYFFNVDWDNDGVFDEFGITGDVSHDYGVPGVKTIRIVGKFPIIYFKQNNSDVQKIIAIEQWGTNQWFGMHASFSDARNLVNNAQDIPNLSIVNSLGYMFNNATLIGGVSDLANWEWDTAMISNVEGMFINATSFNQNISYWNTSGMRYMRWMFTNATSFNQDISSWDTHNVEKMDWTFKNATSFNQDISSWKIGRVGKLDEMFKYTTMSISNYDSLLVNWSNQIIEENINFHAGYSVYCSQAAIDAHDYLINIKGWNITDNGQCQADLTILTDKRLFTDENQRHVAKIMASDSEFDTLDFTIIGGEDQLFFNIDASTGMLTFNIAPDYENPQDKNGDNTYLVEIRVADNGTPQETKTQLFTVIINNVFESMPNDDFVTTWKTNSSGGSNDSSITIQVSSKYHYLFDIDWNNDGVFDEFNISDTISHNYGSSGVRTIRIRGAFPKFITNSEEQIISIDQWGTNPWKSFSKSFEKTKNLIVNASDTPNLSLCLSLNSMFKDSPLVGGSSDISNWNWDTKNVEDMAFMFSNATSFNQDIGKWNTKNVRDMSSMLSNAISFNQDIGKWNTHRVRSMHSMFDNTLSFNQNISHWDVEKVARFDDMLKNIRLSIENYDALLIGWNLQDLIINKTFNGGLSIYCSKDAQTAHNNITSTLNWSISDGGVCEPQLNIISSDFVNIEENETTALRVLTSDPDFDNVNFAITGGADKSLFSINPSTGLLFFNHPPNFENPLDSDKNNDYLVEVTATDDGIPQEFDTQMITVTVSNLDEINPIDLNLQATTSIINNEVIEFIITITNDGTEDAVNAIIFDLLPSSATQSTWTCTATGTATCSFSGIGELNDFVSIPNDFSSITYTVTAILATPTVLPFTYRVFAGAIEPQYDINLSNNSFNITIDIDLIYFNGFE